MLDQIIDLLAPLVVLLTPLAWNLIKDEVKGLPPILIPILVSLISGAATWLTDLMVGGDLESWAYVLAGVGAVFLRELLKHLSSRRGILGAIGRAYLGPPTPGGPRDVLRRRP